MSKPLRGIRRLVASITEAFIKASREGAQCYARIDIDGELDWASDGEISFTLKLDKTKIEQDLERSVRGGVDLATRRIDSWLQEEVSRSLEIQMKNALRQQIKKQIKESI